MHLIKNGVVFDDGCTKFIFQLSERVFLARVRTFPAKANFELATKYLHDAIDAVKISCRLPVV